MGLATRLMRFYFDFAYNRVYDSTTARAPSYLRLQEACLGKFHFQPGDRVLCIGVGTGNEIVRILEMDGGVEIVGTDTSPKALQRASRKAARMDKDVKLLRMDACELQFDSESFDKVFCFHVMDFVGDGPGATREMVRVLKRGGWFVVTYPSAREGIRMGASILKANLNRDSRSLKARARLLLAFAAGIVYVPLLFRGNRRSYDPSDLEAMFSGLGVTGLNIERDALYQNLIVYGQK